MQAIDTPIAEHNVRFLSSFVIEQWQISQILEAQDTKVVLVTLLSSEATLNGFYFKFYGH